MHTITLSPKFQIAIPKAVRERLKLKSGEKLVLIEKGGILHLVPDRNIATLRGALHGMDLTDVREESDRI